MVKDFEVFTGAVDDAVFVMREVAQWCIDKNLNMWKLEDLTKEKLIANLTDDNFCIGNVNGEAAAAMILQWYDQKFWPDIKQNQSGFVHKLCVRREFAGMNLSREMIDYAANECRKRSIEYLRLDTDGSNRRLCSLYENLGFVKAGRKLMNTIDYALYELRLE